MGGSRAKALAEHRDGPVHGHIRGDDERLPLMRFVVRKGGAECKLVWNDMFGLEAKLLYDHPERPPEAVEPQWNVERRKAQERERLEFPDETKEERAFRRKGEFIERVKAEQLEMGMPAWVDAARARVVDDVGEYF